jgi:hypothetical protein
MPREIGHNNLTKLNGSKLQEIAPGSANAGWASNDLNTFRPPVVRENVIAGRSLRISNIQIEVHWWRFTKTGR